MKRSLAVLVITASIFMTSCGSSEDTSADHERTSITAGESVTDAALLDMTIDKVADTVFLNSGIELTDGTPTTDIFCENWYCDDQHYYTQSYEDGIIGAELFNKDIVFSENYPLAVRSLFFRVIEFNTDSELYKNLKAGDMIMVTYTSNDDPSNGWNQPCVISAINGQYAVCITDYEYDPDADDEHRFSEIYMAPFEDEDLQMLYNAFVMIK